MKKIIAILGVMIVSNVYSQTGLDNKLQSLVFKSVDLTKGVEIGKYIDGSPYLVKDFLIGQVEGFPDLFQIRYNAYLDEVQFKKDGALMAFLKEPKYATINFSDTNQQLKLENYNYNGQKVLGYLFVVSSNEDVKIYRKSSVVFQDFKAAKTSYDADKPANFRRIPDVYFIKKGTSDIVELPSNKNKLITMFPEKKEVINQYYKNNSVNLSEDVDLKKLSEIL